MSEVNLKQVIKREYLKCLEDPIHFMRKYCTIQHPQKGKVKFDLYPFQERCLTNFKIVHLYKAILCNIERFKKEINTVKQFRLYKIYVIIIDRSFGMSQIEWKAS